jgi:hypothetical protein
VERDGWPVASYYTSRTDRDYPWMLGMLAPSEIRVVRLPLDALADARAAEDGALRPAGRARRGGG